MFSRNQEFVPRRHLKDTAIDSSDILPQYSIGRSRQQRKVARCNGCITPLRPVATEKRIQFRNHRFLENMTDFLIHPFYLSISCEFSVCLNYRHYLLGTSSNKTLKYVGYYFCSLFYIYIYIYIYMCVCVCVCVYIYIYTGCFTTLGHNCRR